MGRRARSGLDRTKYYQVPRPPPRVLALPDLLALSGAPTLTPRPPSEGPWEGGGRTDAGWGNEASAYGREAVGSAVGRSRAGAYRVLMALV